MHTTFACHQAVADTAFQSMAPCMSFKCDPQPPPASVSNSHEHSTNHAAHQSCRKCARPGSLTAAPMRCVRKIAQLFDVCELCSSWHSVHTCITNSRLVTGSSRRTAAKLAGSVQHDALSRINLIALHPIAIAGVFVPPRVPRQRNQCKTARQKSRTAVFHSCDRMQSVVHTTEALWLSSRLQRGQSGRGLEIVCLMVVKSPPHQ